MKIVSNNTNNKTIKYCDFISKQKFGKMWLSLHYLCLLLINSTLGLVNSWGKNLERKGLGSNMLCFKDIASIPIDYDYTTIGSEDFVDRRADKRTICTQQILQQGCSCSERRVLHFDSMSYAKKHFLFLVKFFYNQWLKYICTNELFFKIVR